MNLSLVTLIVLSIAANHAPQAPELTVHYHVRPPLYTQEVNQALGGLVGDAIQKAFQDSGIKVHYTVTPANRQITLISQNTGNDCAVGWYKNAERETQMRFSVPIYQDKGLLLVYRKGDSRFETTQSLKQVFRLKLVWLKKIGYSYGRYIDETQERFIPPVETSSEENLDLLRMLDKNRADYFLISEEEKDELLQEHPHLSARLISKRLNDLPKGEHRYLVCSIRVPETILNQFNAAILSAKKKPHL